MSVLVLLRHGESAWNAANVFTGWIDVGVSEHGEKQAQRAGALLAAYGRVALDPALDTVAWAAGFEFPDFHHDHAPFSRLTKAFLM
jgi:bisphosphoglycerate-dependent phosphoglycerate mutase